MSLFRKTRRQYLLSLVAPLAAQSKMFRLEKELNQRITDDSNRKVAEFKRQNALAPLVVAVERSKRAQQVMDNVKKVTVSDVFVSGTSIATRKTGTKKADTL